MGRSVANQTLLLLAVAKKAIEAREVRVTGVVNRIIIHLADLLLLLAPNLVKLIIRILNLIRS